MQTNKQTELESRGKEPRSGTDNHPQKHKEDGASGFTSSKWTSSTLAIFSNERK